MKEVGKRDKIYELIKKLTMILFIVAVTMMLFIFMVQVAKWVK